MVTIQCARLANQEVTVSSDISESGKLKFDEKGQVNLDEKAANILASIPGFEIIGGQSQPTENKPNKPNDKESEKNKQLADSLPGQEHLEEKKEIDEDSTDDSDDNSKTTDASESEQPDKSWTVDKLKKYLESKEVPFKSTDTKAVLLQLAENAQ